MNKYKNLRDAISAAQKLSHEEFGFRITLEDDGTFAFYGNGTTVWDETSDRFQKEQLLCELIKSGTSIKEIKRRSSMTFSDIQDYFLKLVGQGRLLNSSIYFCWSDNERNIMQDFLDGKQTKAVVEDNDISEHEIALFSFLRDKYVFYSDLYSIISFLEINIHSLVKRELKRKFKENWWREGVPESLRQKLASDHERDDIPPNYVTEDENKMCYTSFVNLFEIMRKNWTEIFGQPNVLPPIYTADRPKLEKDILKLNRIRNQTMHPLKGNKVRKNAVKFLLELRERFAGQNEINL